MDFVSNTIPMECRTFPLGHYPLRHFPLQFGHSGHFHLVFFYGTTYQKSQSAVLKLLQKGVTLAVVGTVRIGGDVREESSTGEVPRLQKFCRHNC